MNEWKTAPLGEITSFMSKGIAPVYTDERAEGVVVVLNQKCNRNFSISFEESRLHDANIKRVPNDRILLPGDVLINSTGAGTAGRVAQIWNVPSLTTVDGHMIILRCTDSIDPLYYGYALKMHQTQIESLAEGSTGQTEINRKRLCDEVLISYPTDITLQRKIARTLAALDEKIEANRAINDNLQQQAQAIYTSMFVSNADPDWAKGHLSDLITVKYGKDHKKLGDGTYPVFGSGGIMRYVERPLYTAESVLIPRKGTLNNVMYVNEPFWSVDTMFFTEMKIPNVAKFVFHFVKAKDLASMNAGSAVPSMTTDILNALELAIPSAECLAEFESLVAPMYQAMQANNRESAKLAELRDTLLPKLISDEIDVSSIQV